MLNSVFGLLARLEFRSSANLCFRTVSKLVFSCQSRHYYSLSDFLNVVSQKIDFMFSYVFNGIGITRTIKSAGFCLNFDLKNEQCPLKLAPFCASMPTENV